jgi:NAD(P)-dependent dehydrogenase (short-subunit alcohol dehydrogenase family)
MARKKSVLILGASRGLGLALAEEYCAVDYEVVATVRTPSPALEQLHERFSSSLQIKSADTTDPDSIARLKDEFQESQFDTLFVNAGICIARDNTPIDETFRDRVSPRGVIAVMSSEIGSIQINKGKWEMYSASKAALNMLMKCFAARHEGDTRALLLVAPGWVRTEMGGEEATLSIEESVPNVVKSVEAQAGKAGLRFIDRHGETVPW